MNFLIIIFTVAFSCLRSNDMLGYVKTIGANVSGSEMLIECFLDSDIGALTLAITPIFFMTDSLTRYYRPECITRCKNMFRYEILIHKMPFFYVIITTILSILTGLIVIYNAGFNFEIISIIMIMLIILLRSITIFIIYDLVNAFLNNYKIVFMLLTIFIIVCCYTKILIFDKNLSRVWRMLI